MFSISLLFFFKTTLSRLFPHCSMEISHFKVTTDLQTSQFSSDLIYQQHVTQAIFFSVLGFLQDSQCSKVCCFPPAFLMVPFQFPLSVSCLHALFIWGFPGSSTYPFFSFLIHLCPYWFHSISGFKQHLCAGEVRVSVPTLRYNIQLFV